MTAPARGDDASGRPGSEPEPERGPGPEQERTIVVDDLRVDYHVYSGETPMARRIGRRYRRPRLRAVPALRGVSLVVRRGDAVGVIGPTVPARAPCCARSRVSSRRPAGRSTRAGGRASWE